MRRRYFGIVLSRNISQPSSFKARRFFLRFFPLKLIFLWFVNAFLLLFSMSKRLTSLFSRSLPSHLSCCRNWRAVFKNTIYIFGPATSIQCGTSSSKTNVVQRSVSSSIVSSCLGPPCVVPNTQQSHQSVHPLKWKCIKCNSSLFIHEAVCKLVLSIVVFSPHHWFFFLQSKYYTVCTVSGRVRMDVIGWTRFCSFELVSRRLSACGRGGPSLNFACERLPTKANSKSQSLLLACSPSLPQFLFCSFFTWVLPRNHLVELPRHGCACLDTFAIFFLLSFWFLSFLLWRRSVLKIAALMLLYFWQFVLASSVFCRSRLPCRLWLFSCFPSRFVLRTRLPLVLATCSFSKIADLIAFPYLFETWCMAFTLCFFLELGPFDSTGSLARLQSVIAQHQQVTTRTFAAPIHDPTC